MHSLLKAIKDKYRIYLITLVDSENENEGNHKKAKQVLQKLIEEGVS
jgi:hypothetical protein